MRRKTTPTTIRICCASAVAVSDCTARAVDLAAELLFLTAIGRPGTRRPLTLSATCLQGAGCRGHRHHRSGRMVRPSAPLRPPALWYVVKRVLQVEVSVSYIHSCSRPESCQARHPLRSRQCCAGPRLCSATGPPSDASRRTTLLPHENETPETLWSKVAAPDSRFWSATGVYNVPVNITWMSGTMYVVSSELHLHFCASPESTSLHPSMSNHRRVGLG